MKENVCVRAEEEGDRAAVHAVHTAAFATEAEAMLVEVLREQARPVISLVAECGDEIVGHIMFSRVTLSGHPELDIMGLAPMAVAPDHQRRGIGSALVRAGLGRCRALGFGTVVVLGHPDYYPRFGFTPAARAGIGCEYEAPVEAFMLLELERGCLNAASGMVHYHEAFRRAC